MVIDPETKRKFLEIYQTICEEYGMYIRVSSGEGSYGEIGVELETATTPDELNDHFKELKENS